MLVAGFPSIRRLLTVPMHNQNWPSEHTSVATGSDMVITSSSWVGSESS